MKTPFPKYDEALVLAIEDDLNQDRRTDIVHEIDMVNFGPDGTPYEAYTLLQTRGSHMADVDRSITPRMMIQSISTIPSPRSQGVIYNDPCAACDNFAISWRCDEHPELDYDSEKHRWFKPGASDPFATPFQALADHAVILNTEGNPLTFGLPHFQDGLDPDGRILRIFTDALPENATDGQRIAAVHQYLDRLNGAEVIDHTGGRSG